MPFIANHNVSHNGRDYAPDEEVKFKDSEADTAARETLLGCGAIRETEGKSKAEKAAPADKPLATMTKPELEAVAAAEEIDLSAANNNPERVTAIEQARLAKAAAASTDGGATE